MRQYIKYFHTMFSWILLLVLNPVVSKFSMVVGVLSYIWNWFVVITFQNINIVNKAWTEAFFFLFYFILPLIPFSPPPHPPQKKMLFT